MGFEPAASAQVPALLTTRTRCIEILNVILDKIILKRRAQPHTLSIGSALSTQTDSQARSRHIPHIPKQLAPQLQHYQTEKRIRKYGRMLARLGAIGKLGRTEQTELDTTHTQQITLHPAASCEESLTSCLGFGWALRLSDVFLSPSLLTANRAYQSKIQPIRTLLR